MLRTECLGIQKDRRRGLVSAAIWLLCGCLLISSLACSSGSVVVKATGDIPTVVASSYPLSFFTRQIAGDRVRVVTLVPSGVDPHHWEPTPNDIALISTAQVFVINGVGFEPWIGRVLEGVGDGPLVVDSSEGLDDELLGYEHSHEPHGEHNGDSDEPHGEHNGDSDEPHGEHNGDSMDEELLDPHLWLDPVLAAHQVRTIRDALIQKYPDDHDSYESGASDLLSRLDNLDLRFNTGLSNCAKREIIISHAIFGYMADRYQFTMYPIAGLAPEAQPHPALMAELVDLARERGVRTILYERFVNPSLAKTIAKEVGAQAMEVYPLEVFTAEQDQAGEDYFSIMEANLVALKTAMMCGS